MKQLLEEKRRVIKTKMKKKLIATPYDWIETLSSLWRNIAGPKDANEANVRFFPQDSVLNEVRPAIRIGFLGDIMDLGRKRLTVGRDVAAFFSDCDAIVGNFEAMITARSKRSFVQQRHNEAIIADLAAVFPPERTFLNVANNHAADFGIEAFDATVEKLAAGGFHVFGHKDLPYADVASGVRIAAGSMWSNQRCDWIADFKDVLSIPRAQNMNILYPHWGYELELYPRKQIVQFAENLFRPFDAIIGHHSHTPQPVAAVDCGAVKKLVAYSLGDFCIALRYKPYLSGIVVKMTAGPDPRCGSWAVGSVKWSFLGINPRHACRVTNSLQTHSGLFPAFAAKSA